ncbi:MAG TPA: class I SAM-dependent methyltransferase [Gemmatimonadales bacterium]|nr:class I SAM-dependent methyltransferase [Gemmatimonadales bacterium]
MSSSAPPVVCPSDGQQIAAVNGTLVCPRGHAWSVRLGVPRMIPSARTYADAFGLQWNVYRKTQLDSHTGEPISRVRARRCLGEEAWNQLSHHSGTDVLEVGCGAGRFTEILLAEGARVTSVDLSTAVEANQANFPQDERHRVLQADVMQLPFAPGQFDIVFCLGVIQHTPSPEATIAKLYEQVRPGGWLVLDHYAYSLSSLTKSRWLFRLILRRMSPERGLRYTERLVKLFFPLHRAVRKHRVAQALLSRISPVTAYFHSYKLSDELHRQWSLLDTHDSLTDWYKRRRTKGQIRRTLERLGAVDLTCEYGGNGVEARCRRAGPVS